MSRPFGRWLLTLIGVFTATAAYPFDWNHTHVFNPHWPPHAKFHSGISLLVGTLLGGSALPLLWRGGNDPQRLGMAAWLLAIYWLSFGGTRLLPQTAEIDPEFVDHVHIPHVAGIPIAQSAMGVVVLVLTGAGYALERSRLRALHR